MRRFIERLVLWFRSLLIVSSVSDPRQGVRKNSSSQRGPGRPKQEICRDVSRPVRWSALEWKAVQIAASHRGMNVSAYIRQIVLADAGGFGMDQEEEAMG